MLRFTRPTLVTITAPTCSGKNYLRDEIEKRFGWNRIISTTTREMRVGEVQGEDYDFISQEKSLHLEKYNAFAELIEFRGVRYGVLNSEMGNKMNRDEPPMVILEPQGLKIYERLCREQGWDVFKIYISVVESTRIERLMKRTAADVRLTLGSVVATEKVIHTHTDRLLSITGDERRWSNVTTWDAILPGDDIEKAMSGLEIAVAWRNHRVAEPTSYTHVSA